MYGLNTVSADTRSVILAALIAGASLPLIASKYNVKPEQVVSLLNNIQIDPKSYAAVSKGYFLTAEPSPVNNKIVYRFKNFDPDRAVRGLPPADSIPVSATVYNAVSRQTDKTPTITADGTDLNSFDYTKYRVLAVSPDLLRYNGGPFNFGDRVMVEGTGEYDGVWHIHDSMNSRFTNKIDFLVPPHIRNGSWDNVTITPIS